MTDEKRKTRSEAIEELRNHGIEGPEVYLIDIIPLLEMIWADGKVQEGELEIINEFIPRHTAHINEIAGYEMLSIEEGHAFARRFLDYRPDPELMRTLRSLIPSVRFSSSNDDYARTVKKSLLALCLDIASSAVGSYPYGIHERFSLEEKLCFFEILESLEK